MQLSSKCDNRLFRVCFDSLNTPKYPFLRAFSRPIRCVSRNRNHRHPAVSWKRPTPPTAPPENGPSPGFEDSVVPESSKIKNEALANGAATAPAMNAGTGIPSAKRQCTASDKVATPTINCSTTLERPSELATGAFSNVVATDMLAPATRGVNAMPAQLNAGYSWHVSPESRAKEAMGTLGHRLLKQDNLPDGSHAVGTVGLDLPRMHKAFGSGLGILEGAFSDFVVFRYCLENMYARAEFLRGALTSKSDHQISDFATRVSQYTGCRHNGYVSD